MWGRIILKLALVRILFMIEWREDPVQRAVHKQMRDRLKVKMPCKLSRHIETCTSIFNEGTINK